MQFSDGSTWGDADSAQFVLDRREKTLAELDLLEHIYEQRGESAFLDEFAPRGRLSRRYSYVEI